ncbi:hypothetical protein [Nocardia brevicatena]|uniref:hypothetical protein n=1 Tax=Nocardia brevicatena TaxID=37327 RepID=UPI00059309F9|nr:hypothetical protein [Nocardia brevicatena]
MLDIEPAQKCLPQQIDLVHVQVDARCHNHTGFGIALEGNRAMSSRAGVASITGSFPTWKAHEDR